MSTTYPPTPGESLAPSGLLAPSSTTTYVDAPVGHIGGGVGEPGGVVFVASGIRGEPERKIGMPRKLMPQQQPRLIRVTTTMSHDAPRGTIRIAGTVGETFVPGVSRVSPADVLELERHLRLVYPQPEPAEMEQPYAELSRALEPFIGAKP